MTEEFIDMCIINLATSVIFGGGFANDYFDETFYLKKIYEAFDKLPGGFDRFDRKVLLIQKIEPSDPQNPQYSKFEATYRDIILEVAKVYLFDLCNDWVNDTSKATYEDASFIYRTTDGKPTIEYLKKWGDEFEPHEIIESCGSASTNDTIENILYLFINYLLK